MKKNIKSFLYTFFFLYIIYLCIKGLVKMFWSPKNKEDLYHKTKFVFILFFLISLVFILIVHYLFKFEDVNNIYKIYLYSILLLFIVGILNNEIFNIGYSSSKPDEKINEKELYEYFKKSRKD